jgi:hypothetical protein
MPDAHLTPPDVRFATIERFPGYRIGSDGTVWSCWTNSGRQTDRWRQLKFRLGRCDYPTVNIKDAAAGKEVAIHVHRLVLEAFVGPCPDGMECRHLDGSRTNNNVANLCWGTKKENCADTIRHGRTRRGDGVNHSRLHAEQVVEIRAAWAGGASFHGLARRYGVTRRAIQMICKRLSWNHV